MRLGVFGNDSRFAELLIGGIEFLDFLQRFWKEELFVFLAARNQAISFQEVVSDDVGLAPGALSHGNAGNLLSAVGIESKLLIGEVPIQVDARIRAGLQTVFLPVGLQHGDVVFVQDRLVLFSVLVDGL